MEKAIVGISSVGLLLMGMAATPNQAMATTKKQKVIVVSNKKIKRQKYTFKGGAIYRNSKLSTRYSSKLVRAVVGQEVYSSRKVVAKRGGKQLTYRYVYNKKFRGFTWKGNLKLAIKKKAADFKPANTDPNGTQSNQTKSQADTPKSVSKTQLVDMINATADMNPSTQLLNLNQTIYANYSSILGIAYNLSKLYSGRLFINNQAHVYIASPELKQYATAAMNTWNQALGSQVFVEGTDNNHTITVRLADRSASDWDGLFSGDTISIDSSRFNNSGYPMNYLASSISSQVNRETYWRGVLTHELGHSMGLDHTAYQSDIMYAPTSNGNVIAKYTWKSPVERSASGLSGVESGNLTVRDINRAKLANVLGYW